MVAYAFEKRHHHNLLDGSKPFTLRNTGKKRHARIGEALQMRDGRTGPVFATGQCTFRARVLFAARGVVRVLNPLFLPDGDRVWRLFSQSEQGMPQATAHLQKLAEADGFTTWDDLVRWHAEQGAPDENGLLGREVIGFAQVAPLLAVA